MNTSENINEIAEALSKAQGMINGGEEDGYNPHFKSKYLTLDAVWKCLRSPLSSNGLSVVQDIRSENNGVFVETRVFHKSGQWISFSPLFIPIQKADAQGYGAAMTYGKRYSLCAALGIVAEEDDDANSISNVEEKKSEEPLITEKQVELITSLLEQMGDSGKEIVKNSLSYYKAERVGNLKLTQAAELIKMLMKKKGA